MSRSYISLFGLYYRFWPFKATKDNVNWSILGTKDDTYLQPRYWYIKLPRGTTNIHLELPYHRFVDSEEYYALQDQLVAKYNGEGQDFYYMDDQVRHLCYKDLRHLNLGGSYPSFYLETLDEILDNLDSQTQYIEDCQDATCETMSGVGGWFDIFAPFLVYDGSVTNIYTMGYGNTSIQVFHTDGSLLVGTPLTGYDLCRETMIGGGTDCYLDFHDNVSRFLYYSDESYQRSCASSGRGGPTPWLNYPVSATGAALWEKCGLWADWYSYLYSMIEAEYNPGDIDHKLDSGYRPANGYQVTPADLDHYLHKIDPKVFTSADFHFTDAFVNGTGQPLWRTSDDQQTIVVEGETIKWTGNSAGPWATPFIVGASFLGNVYGFERMELSDHAQWPDHTLGPRSFRFKNLQFRTKPNEVLDIEELQFDSIIMIPAIFPYNAFGWYDLPDLPTYSPGVSLCKGRPRLWRLKDGVEDENDEDNG